MALTLLFPRTGLTRDLEGALVAVERDDTSQVSPGGGLLNDELRNQTCARGHVQMHKRVGHPIQQSGDQVAVDLAILRYGREVAEMKVTHARGATFVRAIRSLQGMA